MLYFNRVITAVYSASMPQLTWRQVVSLRESIMSVDKQTPRYRCLAKSLTVDRRLTKMGGATTCHGHLS